jgi:hypothetical protein
VELLSFTPSQLAVAVVVLLQVVAQVEFLGVGH